MIHIAILIENYFGWDFVSLILHLNLLLPCIIFIWLMWTGQLWLLGLLFYWFFPSAADLLPLEAFTSNKVTFYNPSRTTRSKSYQDWCEIDVGERKISNLVLTNEINNNICIMTEVCTCVLYAAFLVDRKGPIGNSNCHW